MRIFISGGSGFLGRSLIPFIKANRTFHEIILRPRSEYCSGMLDGIDLVIHLAGLKVGSARQLVEANVTLTQKLIDESIRAKVQRFVFISTYCVYGYQTQLPSDEGIELHPVGNYALSKAIAEEIIRESCASTRSGGESGLSYTILRLSHVFGFGRSRSAVDGWTKGDDIVTQMMNANPIQIQGNGSNTIDLIPLHDACYYISQLMNDDRTKDQIINVGSGQSRSIKQIATEISLWRNNAISHSGQHSLSRAISISKLQSLVDINPASINNLIYDYVNESSHSIGSL